MELTRVPQKFRMVNEAGIRNQNLKGCHRTFWRYKRYKWHNEQIVKTKSTFAISNDRMWLPNHWQLVNIIRQSYRVMWLLLPRTLLANIGGWITTYDGCKRDPSLEMIKPKIALTGYADCKIGSFHHKLCDTESGTLLLLHQIVQLSNSVFTQFELQIFILSPDFSLTESRFVSILIRDSANIKMLTQFKFGLKCP